MSTDGKAKISWMGWSILTILLSLLTIYFGFLPTYAIYEEEKLLSKEVEPFVRWKSDNTYDFESIKFEKDSVKEPFQHAFIKTVNAFAQQHPTRIEYMSSPMVSHESGFEISTIEAHFSGPFNNLIKLTHHLEKNFRHGRVVSLRFHLENDSRKYKNQLILYLYVQNFKMGS